MRVAFWGVRGSLPAPKRSAWRYGGNTSCLEVGAADQVIILDAGNGIQDLGLELRSQAAAAGLTASLLFTHYHWDHIQGLPFFEPIYVPGNTLHLFGPHPEGGVGLFGVLDELFRAPFFPVSAQELKSTYDLKELAWESAFSLGDVRLRTCRLHHPQGAVAYRLDHRGASIVYATDHEPGHPACDLALRELARGADLLISDAQYLPEELPKKTGWGHGSWESAIAIARDAGVKNLFLFHHDPLRTDNEIDQIVLQARRVFPNTWAASETMLVEVTRKQFHVGCRENGLGPRAATRANGQAQPWTNGEPRRDRPALGLDRLEEALPPRREELIVAAASPERAVAAPTAVASPPSGGKTAANNNGGGNGPGPLQEWMEQTVSAHAMHPFLPGAEPPPQRDLSAQGEQMWAGAGAPPPAPSFTLAESQLPASAAASPLRRRYERVRVEGTNAYGVIRNGFGPLMLRVYDLSFGGVSFLVDDASRLPQSFDARLHVPVMPASELPLERVHSTRLPDGSWRIGCRFAP